MTGSQTLLAFDFGTKRTGVAVGQSLTKTANQLCTLAMVGNLPEISSTKKVINEWQPNLVIIGLPDSASKGFKKKIRGFQRFLLEEFELNSVTVDETLTTEQANYELYASDTKKKNKSNSRDQIAARLILETYFESLV